jgi:P-type Ca2+ transporter type 2C
MSAHSTDASAGLSAAEARRRLESEGFNELPAAGRLSLARLVLGVVREPMFALLLAAALIYLLIGDLAESLLMLAFATISITIAVVQQGRSERALEALRELTSPRALVIRDGRKQRIPGREVVRGDVVVISEGDRVPADGAVVAGDHIEVDESLLTGESMAVPKRAVTDVPERLPDPGGATGGAVFGGTLVVRGSGLAVIVATGTRSAIGAIGGSLAQLSREQPRLERETRRLVAVFGIAALTLSIAATLAYGLMHDAWVPALLGGIALGMALLPEEFPLVLTVFTVMGARRLSRSRVLTRRAAAIEALGAATVLCTDKTGTLTRNLMTVAHLEGTHSRWSAGSPPAAIAADAQLAALLSTALLASDHHRIDPMERALGELDALVERPPPGGGTMLREYPLRPGLLAVTRVWDLDDGDGLTVAAKGAPEAILRLCRIEGAGAAAIEARVEALARAGVRVIAVARAGAPRGAAEDLPHSRATFAFQLLGLVGFADPLRESVPAAVRECRAAGIRVVMITGDFPATARAIAAQAGIDAGTLLTGAEVESLDDAALSARVRDAAIFARISPAQKLRIVEALKRNGEVVAMTGDGVNDAPALKSAHIGIAMGGRGTDVAREAASMVLLDDDFGSIVRAIRVGRRIYDNLRKAMGYIFAIHVPIAGLALLPVLAGWPLILTPLLIALLELIIDPACSVVLEAEREERDIMDRPPRARDSSLLSRPLVAWCLLQGVAALSVVCAVLIHAMGAGLSDDAARTVAFLTLVGVNVALVFVNRTFASSLRAALGRSNPVLWWGLALVVGVLAGIVAWPGARAFFGMTVLPAAYVGVAIGAAIGLLAVLEVAKLFWHRRLVN